MPNNFVVVDLDDFCESNNSLDRLLELKLWIPQFKATLFAIPYLFGLDFLCRVSKLTWLELVPHGWQHQTPRECQDWTYERSVRYLDHLKPLYTHLGWARGFKAPGWQISDGMYRALVERGFWVADQEYNNHRRPPELPCYLLDSPLKVHGHIGAFNGPSDNELSLIEPRIMGLKNKEFLFVSEAIERERQDATTP